MKMIRNGAVALLVAAVAVAASARGNLKELTGC